MTDEDLTALLDRAAGPGDLAADVPARAELRGRTLLRRRRIATAAAGLAVAAALVTTGAALMSFTAPRPPDTAAASGTAVAPAPADPVLDAFRAERDAKHVLLAGEKGRHRVVVQQRPAHTAEAAVGGKAARIFVSTDGGPFQLVSNYISYDATCRTGDQVCASISPLTGLFVVVPVDNGRMLAVTVVPDGFTLLGFRTDAGQWVPAAGTLTELDATKPWAFHARAATPDGRQYDIPLPPGGVIDKRVTAVDDGETLD